MFHIILSVQPTSFAILSYGYGYVPVRRKYRKPYVLPTDRPPTELEKHLASYPIHRTLAEFSADEERKRAMKRQKRPAGVVKHRNASKNFGRGHQNAPKPRPKTLEQKEKLNALTRVKAAATGRSEAGAKAKGRTTPKAGQKITQAGTKGVGGLGVGEDFIYWHPRAERSRFCIAERGASEVSTGRPQVCNTPRQQFAQLHTMLARSIRANFAAASKRPYICQSCICRAGRSELGGMHLHPLHLKRYLQTETPASFRKTLKDAAKEQKKGKKQDKALSEAFPDSSTKENDTRAKDWELTVGIEVHAELNTARKLFSKATTSVGDAPNTHAALFDVAFPGSQPMFQQDTLVPALRAAIAFQCEIPHQSSFDRKHYFYQDQPNGYQITQYYEPFAKNGNLLLYPHDFPPGTPLRSEPLRIGIKQIQMEQDTAKTVQQPPSTHLLDFNRVSHPLIEIITMPEIHDPTVAAAAVRKIQMILKSVDACTTGMELGGLRADVNVSVRRRDESSQGTNHSYYGITGLGQRTEIKNLASVKAIEDAIVAERDRQIEILENGGVIEGETRGWTLGSTTTKRLRSKEGEIDYRYMPDPDIAPIIITDELIKHLRETLPTLPDPLIHRMTCQHSLTAKDAMTLLTIDDGERVEYFLATVAKLYEERDWHDWIGPLRVSKMAGDWVLMELGSFFKNQPWDANRVPSDYLADIISHVCRKVITSPTGKLLLTMKFEGDERSVAEIVKEESLALNPMNEEEYKELAQTLLEENPEIVSDILSKGQTKKVFWFMGQMIGRAPKGSIEPMKAKNVLHALLGLDGKDNLRKRMVAIRENSAPVNNRLTVKVRCAGRDLEGGPMRESSLTTHLSGSEGKLPIMRCDGGNTDGGEVVADLKAPDSPNERPDSMDPDSLEVDDADPLVGFEGKENVEEEQVVVPSEEEEEEQKGKHVADHSSDSYMARMARMARLEEIERTCDMKGKYAAIGKRMGRNIQNALPELTAGSNEGDKGYNAPSLPWPASSLSCNKRKTPANTNSFESIFTNPYPQDAPPWLQNTGNDSTASLLRPIAHPTTPTSLIPNSSNFPAIRKTTPIAPFASSQHQFTAASRLIRDSSSESFLELLERDIAYKPDHPCFNMTPQQREVYWEDLSTSIHSSKASRCIMDKRLMRPLRQGFISGGGTWPCNQIPSSSSSSSSSMPAVQEQGQQLGSTSASQPPHTALHLQRDLEAEYLDLLSPEASRLARENASSGPPCMIKEPEPQLKPLMVNGNIVPKREAKIKNATGQVLKKLTCRPRAATPAYAAQPGTDNPVATTKTTAVPHKYGMAYLRQKIQRYSQRAKRWEIHQDETDAEPGLDKGGTAPPPLHIHSSSPPPRPNEINHDSPPCLPGPPARLSNMILRAATSIPSTDDLRRSNTRRDGTITATSLPVPKRNALLSELHFHSDTARAILEEMLNPEMDKRMAHAAATVQPRRERYVGGGRGYGNRGGGERDIVRIHC
ncbi:hypothetical protein GMOD_00005080 [Pyrenophora seminiperda CCB06]|uniref:Glutamyl-tRNA(Gln) amidotransferase subunit B, mitochondrial n=1 Tax=Pyrenophora seminiperda CCB06 TaxID=1302712 RepID=A0A3M7LUP2_9PLEO|nr:hypothetical protein GMOD_00005080 [Pyrenophora seminiperda CCB06]